MAVASAYARFWPVYVCIGRRVVVPDRASSRGDVRAWSPCGLHCFLAKWPCGLWPWRYEVRNTLFVPPCVAILPLMEAPAVARHEPGLRRGRRPHQGPGPPVVAGAGLCQHFQCSRVLNCLGVHASTQAATSAFTVRGWVGGWVWGCCLKGRGKGEVGGKGTDWPNWQCQCYGTS